MADAEEEIEEVDLEAELSALLDELREIEPGLVEKALGEEGAPAAVEAVKEDIGGGDAEADALADQILAEMGEEVEEAAASKTVDDDLDDEAFAALLGNLDDTVVASVDSGGGVKKSMGVSWDSSRDEATAAAAEADLDEEALGDLLSGMLDGIANGVYEVETKDSSELEKKFATAALGGADADLDDDALEDLLGGMLDGIASGEIEVETKQLSERVDNLVAEAKKGVEIPLDFPVEGADEEVQLTDDLAMLLGDIMSDQAVVDKTPVAKAKDISELNPETLKEHEDEFVEIGDSSGDNSMAEFGDLLDEVMAGQEVVTDDKTIKAEEPEEIVPFVEADLDDNMKDLLADVVDGQAVVGEKGVAVEAVVSEDVGDDDLAANLAGILAEGEAEPAQGIPESTTGEGFTEDDDDIEAGLGDLFADIASGEAETSPTAAKEDVAVESVSEVELVGVGGSGDELSDEIQNLLNDVDGATGELAGVDNEAINDIDAEISAEAERAVAGAVETEVGKAEVAEPAAVAAVAVGAAEVSPEDILSDLASEQVEAEVLSESAAAVAAELDSQPEDAVATVAEAVSADGEGVNDEGVAADKKVKGGRQGKGEGFGVRMKRVAVRIKPMVEKTALLTVDVSKPVFAMMSKPLMGKPEVRDLVGLVALITMATGVGLVVFGLFFKG